VKPSANLVYIIVTGLLDIFGVVSIKYCHIATRRMKTTSYVYRPKQYPQFDSHEPGLMHKTPLHHIHIAL
jgi:hypothetical protein